MHSLPVGTPNLQLTCIPYEHLWLSTLSLMCHNMPYDHKFGKVLTFNFLQVFWRKNKDLLYYNGLIRTTLYNVQENPFYVVYYFNFFYCQCSGDWLGTTQQNSAYGWIGQSTEPGLSDSRPPPVDTIDEDYEPVWIVELNDKVWGSIVLDEGNVYN